MTPPRRHLTATRRLLIPRVGDNLPDVMVLRGIHIHGARGVLSPGVLCRKALIAI